MGFFFIIKKITKREILFCAYSVNFNTKPKTDKECELKCIHYETGYVKCLGHQELCLRLDTKERREIWSEE